MYSFTYCVDTTVTSYLPYQRVSPTTSGSPLCGLCYNDKGDETKLFNFIQFIYATMWSDVKCGRA